MKKRSVLMIFLVLSISLFLITEVSSSTATLDKTDYALTETASATFTCGGNEKNQAYIVNWTNTSGYQVEVDTGDTGDCTTFLQNFVINSSYISVYGNTLNVTLQGTNLEGTDNASVSTASSSTLLVSSITHQGTFLGLSSSIDSNVDDENGKAISGGICDANVEDPSNDQVLHTIRSTIIDGNLDFIWSLEHEQFKENKDYVAKISCFCGSEGGIYECINEDGENVNNSIGSSDVAFRTSSWINFNEDPFPTALSNGTKSADQSLFAGFDIIHWLRNVSNNNPDLEPVEVKTRTILVKNDTQQIFGLVNEGNDAGELDGFPKENSTSFRMHKISQLAETGVYFIRVIYDVIYKNQFQVAQYIKTTETFNITSVRDSITVNNVRIRDYKDNLVDTNSSLQGSSDLHETNNTAPYTMLTEGFVFDFCLNITNNRLEDSDIFLHTLAIENPTRGESIEIISEELFGNQQVGILDGNSTEEICFRENMPLNMVTHSDYRLIYDHHVGEHEVEFNCGDECNFEAKTDFFYVGAIEDMISFNKFLRKPNATDLGNPGVYIVNENNEYIKMFDDVNYTAQEDIDWGNGSVICNAKDDVTTIFACSYKEFVTAGEKLKVCFEARNYLRDEIFIDFSNIYLDVDVGDTIVTLTTPDEFIQNGLKSITDSDLYLEFAPSRSLEADGNLLDGYATLCTPFFDVPIDIEGGNSWDVQGDVRISKKLYDLEEDILFTFESDEFPIFGSRKGNSYPDFLTIHNVTIAEDNATEGEGFRFEINFSINHPTKSLELSFQMGTVATTKGGSIGGGQRIKPSPTEESTFPDSTLENEDGISIFYKTSHNFLGGRHFQSFKPVEFRVPFGLIDNNFTEIQTIFSAFFGNEESFEIKFPSSTGKIDIIGKALEVTNVTTSLGLHGQSSACNPIQYTFEYDNIQSNSSKGNDERYIAKTCIQDTTNDFYLSCTNIIIEPDTGTGNIGNVSLLIPYIPSPVTIQTEADVWIYEYDKNGVEGDCKNCGALVDFFTSPSSVYNITTNQTDSCKYQSTLIQGDDKTLQLLQAQREALEDSASFLGGINSSAGTFDFSITVPNTGGDNVLVSGSGKTGKGTILNRDVSVTCQVDKYPVTSKTFKIFATDTFSFNELVAVPSPEITYTMSCTVTDSFFGTDSVQATTNFARLSGGNLGGFFGKLEDFGEKIIDKIVGTIKEPKGIGLFLIILLGSFLLVIFVISRNRKVEVKHNRFEAV